MNAVVAAALLVLLLPLVAVVAMAVKAGDGGPVFFTQQRVGRGGRPFSCLKFRSMVIDADRRLAAILAADPELREEWARGQKFQRDPRVTGIGAFLRRSSLDELPQLINILRGDMALVGPRPVLPDELDRYGRSRRHYCAVKPGITGLWQVSGRNALSYRKRVALDRLYASRRSVWLDTMIALRTIPAVLLARGSL